MTITRHDPMQHRHLEGTAVQSLDAQTGPSLVALLGACATRPVAPPEPSLRTQQACLALTDSGSSRRQSGLSCRTRRSNRGAGSR